MVFVVVVGLILFSFVFPEALFQSLIPPTRRLIKCPISTQNGIVSLVKTQQRSAQSLSSLRKVTVETVPGVC